MAKRVEELQERLQKELDEFRAKEKGKCYLDCWFLLIITFLLSSLLLIVCNMFEFVV